MSEVVWWFAGSLAFGAATGIFYFFPRTTAATAALALQGLIVWWGPSLLFSSQLGRDTAVAAVTMVFFTWLIPGFAEDRQALHGRWQHLTSQIRDAF